MRRFFFSLFFLLVSLLIQAQHISDDQLLPATYSVNDSILKVSYFNKFGIKVDTIYNHVLYNTVSDWLGTRYRYGGRSKEGIDCSDFTSVLYKESYNIDLSGSAGDIYKKTTPINKSDLREGDMVFFKIRSRSISHVGVYLCNNKFAHATTNAGVVISDLNEPYYLRYFYIGGFIPNKTQAPEHFISVKPSAPIVPFVDYSKLMGFKIDTVYNSKLYDAVKSLIGKPLKKKSKKVKDRDGAILCSILYSQAYNIGVYGNASDILRTAKPLTKGDLKEGDIIFFKSLRKRATKVGVYLSNNKFVHLSPKRTVAIGDLREANYKKSYYRGGRITNQ